MIGALAIRSKNRRPKNVRVKKLQPQMSIAAQNDARNISRGKVQLGKKPRGKAKVDEKSAQAMFIASGALVLAGGTFMVPASISGIQVYWYIAFSLFICGGLVFLFFCLCFEKKTRPDAATSNVGGENGLADKADTGNTRPSTQSLVASTDTTPPVHLNGSLGVPSQLSLENRLSPSDDATNTRQLSSDLSIDIESTATEAPKRSESRLDHVRDLRNASPVDVPEFSAPDALEGDDCVPKSIQRLSIASKLARTSISCDSSESIEVEPVNLPVVST